MVTVSDAPGRLRATLAEAADSSRLAAAWDEVLASDLHDGILGAGVARFAQDTEQNLAGIAAELTAGDYHPGRLTPVSLPTPDGQIRVPRIRRCGTGSWNARCSPW